MLLGRQKQQQQQQRQTALISHLQGQGQPVCAPTCTGTPALSLPWGMNRWWLRALQASNVCFSVLDTLCTQLRDPGDVRAPTAVRLSKVGGLGRTRQSLCLSRSPCSLWGLERLRFILYFGLSLPLSLCVEERGARGGGVETERERESLTNGQRDRQTGRARQTDS